MSKLFHQDPTVWERAAALFGKTEKSLDEDVETIKTWMKTQPHLPEIMGDIKIRNFLLLNKCSVEKTKQKIDMYYTIRTVIPDLYEDSNPGSPHMKNFFDDTYLCMAPKLHQGLYRIVFYKLKISNQYAPKETAIQVVNIAELRLHEDCMMGEIWVVDLENSTLTDMAKASPSVMAKLIAVYQKVYSFRLKAAYFVNSPSYISMFMTVLKAIIKPKIFERVQVHQDAKILNQLFSKDELPKDYGGDGPSLDELQEKVKSTLKQYQERFDILDNLKVDENLRPEKLNNDEILGFHGNFKKLSVD